MLFIDGKRTFKYLQASISLMKKGFKKRLVFLFIIAFFVAAAVFFWPAGTLNWTEAWLYLAIQFSFSGYIAVWALKHSPGLIESRMSKKLPVKTFDKVIMSIFLVVMLALILMPGFDKRCNWSEVPVFAEALGFAGLVVSLYALLLTMKENPYLFKIVSVEEKQKVVTTGPYSYVRHPMYATMFIYFPAFALALGSYYSLVPAALSIIVLAVRTYFEDNTLKKELKDYRKYMKKVRYRLIPGIW